MPKAKNTPLNDQKWQQHLLPQHPQTHLDCIWVHACSVGEVASIIPLIQWLHSQGFYTHLTVTTRTGFQHAQRMLGAHHGAISYLPWDLPGLMSVFIKHLKPALLLLTETEFWPGMLKYCHKQQVKVIGINTRISDRSFPRYKASRFFWKYYLQHVQLFLAQSTTDAERLEAMGIEPQCIQVAGNLKYALQAPLCDATALRRRLDPSEQRPILLLASSHDQEEQKILSLLDSWHHIEPDLLTIIVPRHPERFEQVAQLVKTQGLRLSRWSDGTASAQSDVILIDAMGVLQQLYCIADIAIIGGSLCPVGGHNPLEAAVCGRGVLTGPHIQNFREIMTQMQVQGAAIITQSDQELESAIVELLQQPEHLRQLHSHASVFMQDKNNIMNNICQAIQPYLPEKPCN
ncbi:MAG: 3-deoxy-D-manno-octulosonic acid transferase [Mariprofundaceae bacterium]